MPSCSASPSGKWKAIPPNATAAAELTAYKTAETILAHQEAVDQQIKDLANPREGAPQAAQSPGSAPTDEPTESVSFIEFDRLVNRLAAEQARTELVRTKLKPAKAALEQAQTDLNTREQERRNAKRRSKPAKMARRRPRVATAVDDAKRASAVATDCVALRKKELQREKLADAVNG